MADLARSWGASASIWVGSAVEALRRPAGGDLALHEFADVLVEVRDRNEIDAALVELVHRMSGARKVELFREIRPASPSLRVAPVPTSDGPDGNPTSDDQDPARSDPVLAIPLRFGERSLGTLRLYPHDGQGWDSRLARRIATLCVMAAAAESGLLAASGGGAPPRQHVPTHDAAALGAILPYALDQARRHREPLTLLCVELDRLAAIQALHGAEFAGDVLDLAVRTIRGIIRGSDLVAQLDGGRLIVVLPEAGAEDAQRIAESIRATIAGVAAASRMLPALTTSIGLASYPSHADDATALLSAALDATEAARRDGRDRVVSATERSARLVIA